MIIIEGPNGAGKSILAAKLARDLNFTVHKFTKIPQTLDEFNEQVGISIDLVLGKKAVIQDRCPMISDWIYSVFNANRAPFMTIGQAKVMLSDLRPVLIFCESYKLNPKNRSLHRQTEKDIRRAYIQFFRFLKAPFFNYDYARDNYDELLESLPFIPIARKKTKRGHWWDD